MDIRTFGTCKVPVKILVTLELSCSENTAVVRFKLVQYLSMFGLKCVGLNL